MSFETNEQFDAAFLIDVEPNLPDKERAVGNVRAVLTKNARLVMTAWLHNEKPNFAEREFLIKPFCRLAAFPYMENFSGYKEIFEKLGIELHDVDGFSCCPDPTGIEQIDHNTWLALGARNLSLCNNNGGVISFCSGCVETLKGVNYYINKDLNVKKEVNKYLQKIGKEYEGKTEVKHFAQVLYENIEKVKEKIDGY